MSVLPFPVVERSNALRPDVLTCPWLRTLLLLTTPIARAVEFRIEPGKTVTLTFVLGTAAETTVEAGGGLGATVSQTTFWFDVG